MCVVLFLKHKNGYEVRISDWSSDVCSSDLDPPLDLREGDFGQREQRTLDRRALARIAIWCGFILFASFLIALIGIARQHMAAEQLDAESLMLARQVLP